jgi:hypothetical protein
MLLLTTKTGRHDIVEILLKVALSTINQIKSNQIIFSYKLVATFLCPSDMGFLLFLSNAYTKTCY